MFGPRRPVLGAAVLVGASRSAARREVEKQAQQNAEMQRAAERAADQKRRDEEEMERRTQLAIDEAIAKERNKAEHIDRASYSTTGVSTEPGTTHQINQTTPYAGQSRAANTRYCPNCGKICERGDKFCSMCGYKQPTDEGPAFYPY
ncbi:hypothetical protein K432DRAFT_349245 [Lepidopterella palustris CBS 459.81]|uniref:Zinc-ribbon domain-containing protein n=1 Tax=Lepidopterella palustris CBS 459.81 TaxID=1314670 RepID=A0A8E2JHC1_9PEZI|nr:hypothetical protein K432DRAFT_349245 [Lepidopterella palustris CBS 459.81]